MPWIGLMSDLPIPNCYWVVPGQFAAGEYPGRRSADSMRERLVAFLRCGFDYFVDLTESGELEPYAAELASIPKGGAPATYRRMPIRDVGVPRTREEMAAILDTIDEALAAGRTVYVHCWGGVGRTGTVVGCWFVRHGREGQGALREVMCSYGTMAKASSKPESPETEEQRTYVRDWREPDRRADGSS